MISDDITRSESEVVTARTLLADLDEHARAMDTATGSTTCSAEAARRHERLAELTAAGSP